MRFRRFIFASLTAMLASLPTSSPLVACERCRGSSPCHTCGSTDDRGLLDALDLASHRLQPCLPRLTMPRVPSLDTTLRLAFGGRVSGRLGASCGCELKPASCGCELHEPSCGCESTAGCDCQAHQSAVSTHSDAREQPWNSFQSESATSVPRHVAPQVIPLPAPYVAPRGSHQPTVPHIDSYQPAPLPSAQSPTEPRTPGRSRVPEVVPVPDSQIDPFRDDSATRVRQIPSRTIQYRQSAPTYRQNYDPQASTGTIHMRLSDDTPPATQRLALDDQSSSRSRNLRGHNQDAAVEHSRPEVITASNAAPHSSLRSYDQQNTEPSPIGPSNPLR